MLSLAQMLSAQAELDLGGPSPSVLTAHRLVTRDWDLCCSLSKTVRSELLRRGRTQTSKAPMFLTAGPRRLPDSQTRGLAA